MRAPRVWSAAICAALALAAAANRAEAQTSPKAAVESSAQRLLQSATDYLKAQSSFAFSADIVHEDVQPPDLKVQHHASAQYMIVRPGQLRIDYSSDTRQASFYIDGKTFVLFDRAANTYGVLQAATDIDATLNTILDKYDFSVPLADLVSNDPYKALASSVRRGYDLGPSTVGGFTTHHLLFVQPDVDWQLWVDAGPTPLVRELEITYKNLPGQPEYMATLTDWKFTPVDASVFGFTAPKGAALIEFIAVHK